jgi:hypothetical protein
MLIGNWLRIHNLLFRTFFICHFVRATILRWLIEKPVNCLRNNAEIHDMVFPAVLLFKEAALDKLHANAPLLPIRQAGLGLKIIDTFVDPALPLLLAAARGPVDQLAQEDGFIDPHHGR